MNIVFTVAAALVAITLILAGLKLGGVIGWRWWLVLLPTLVLLAILCGLGLVLGICAAILYAP